MRIRIDDQFDDKTELEYDTVDNDSIIGNGVLGNECSIIEVKDFKEVKEENNDSIHEDNKYNVVIEGGTFVDGSSDDIVKVEKNKTNIKGKNKENKKINGKIIVTSRLGGENGTVISSARINLYALNGISPKLIHSKLTDTNGIVIFDNLSKGSYRVIAIVDRKYFEKPTYIEWNEVTINEDLTEENITVINKIKGFSNK